ncbi:MAG: hypothetical protein P8P74_02630, partial [Crocinitomicaceae bacterium]|nr:hypothetical protein [Crocinitomicaceae bacterium]
MKEVSYTKEPEAFEQAIHSIQKFFHANKRFQGIFLGGTIDGYYLSNRLIYFRRMFSIVRLNGSYSLEGGTINLKISKS